MGLAQDAEALGLKAQGAEAEVRRPKLQIQSHAVEGVRILGKMGPVAKDGGELPGQKPPGRDEPVGLRRHIEGQSLDVGGVRPILGHDLLVGAK